MASLHKQRGKPNWFCAFTTHDGVRHFKSTGTTDRQQAEQICRTWAQTALYGDGMTADKAREIISRGVETAMLAAGQNLPGTTIKSWCVRWLETKEVENESSTHSRYELALRSFLEHLGAKASRRLESLTADTVLEFRDKCAKTHAVPTANLTLRILRACLNSARRQGLITTNPAAQVSALRARGESRRREMTLDEIRKVIKTCADTPWRGLVLTGLYTGQRLGDVARLTWQQVDVQKKTIWFVTRKTGKRLAMSVADPLLEFLTSLPASDDPSAPVFPRFAELANRPNGVAQISNAFADEVLIPSKLMLPRHKKRESSGKGRKGERLVNAVTFHSLRHSFTTMLKATGASNAIAQLIVGHDSASVSARYTHLAHEDTVDAISKLPDVTKPQAPKPEGAKK